MDPKQNQQPPMPSVPSAPAMQSPPPQVSPQQFVMPPKKNNNLVTVILVLLILAVIVGFVYFYLNNQRNKGLPASTNLPNIMVSPTEAKTEEEKALDTINIEDIDTQFKGVQADVNQL